MSNSSNAWLIETNSGHTFAIAEYELIEFLMEPVRHEIPLTPAYASSLLLWQESMVVVIDFSLLINQQPLDKSTVGVLAYQNNPGDELKYIGIELNSPPVKITIEDSQACEPQDTNDGLWTQISNSWFMQQDQATPIVNIASLDSPEFSDFAKALNTQEDEQAALEKLAV